MKFKIYINLLCVECVAPLVGAWIEIIGFEKSFATSSVAPLVGAWIEILFISYGFASDWSLLL